jgi:uncharacterized protein (TIGR03435 family)
MFMRALLVVAATSVLLAGQAARPAFDAASVKPNPAITSGIRVNTFPNRFSGVNMTLRMLIGYAFNLPAYRMSEGPTWFDADRFDIEATASEGGDIDAMRARMRALLGDRFRLRTHMEMRELPIYMLTVARRDGKLGDDIKPSGNDCLPVKPPPGAPPPPPPPPGGAIPSTAQCPSMLGLGNISGRKLTIDQLAATLSTHVNRPVVNRTDLTGLFDIDLRYMPDYTPFIPAGAPPLPTDPNAPPLFTAVQEQLGLKLETARGPVDVLVIDSVEKPSVD